MPQIFNIRCDRDTGSLTGSRNAARPRKKQDALFAGLLTLLLWLSGQSVLGDDGAGRVEYLDVITASGPHTFAVEVMSTEPERERGLMFRHALPENRGMLFDLEVEQTVQMWMKNTYLPLDMIFISRSGKVVSIFQNAEPQSERIIYSGAPAYAVIEINAGAVATIGLKTGDRVQHPLFSNCSQQPPQTPSEPDCRP